MSQLTCQYCRQQFTPSPWEEPVTCPHCGEELSGQSAADTLRTVARVSNLAEVGYFEEVLQAAGIETKILEHDDFNAVSGGWHRTYVLRVAPHQADEAVQLLERALDATSDTDEADRIKPANTQGRFATGGIFALLAAGLLLLLYLGADDQRWLDGGHVGPADERAAGPSPALWRALAEESTPLSTPQEGKRSRRRLYYDEDRDVILLEEDHDGDSRIDRTRGFRGAGVIFDRDW